MGSSRNKAVGKLALAASAAALAVALPSSVFAIGFLNGGDASQIGGKFTFTPGSADPDVAELIAQSSGGQAQMVRFTPARNSSSLAARSITVSVRVDQQTAQSLAGTSSALAGLSDTDGSLGGIGVSPMRYNLGLARGYGRFAQSSAQIAAPSAIAAQSGNSSRLSSTLSDAEIPDLASFVPQSGARNEDSRFAARVELDEGTPVAASNARETVSDQLLDVGGSYRLTNNLDITAGVRIEQDRDIVPLPEVDQQDSQAVYIGTQFRF